MSEIETEEKNDQLSLEEAAKLVGKSVSTLRVLIPQKKLKRYFFL